MKTASLIRWILAVLFLLALTLTLSSPALAELPALSGQTAEVKKTLPADYRQGGTAPKAEGWQYDSEGLVTGYEDSTIHLTVERETVTLNINGFAVDHEGIVLRIEIQDPSQLRAAPSMDTYTGRGQALAVDIARSKNAVAATNGDFFKYENDVGYVVRHGEFIRDATGNRRGRIFDMLLVDSAGDFHIVPSAKTETIEAFIADELTPKGLTVLHTFNLGPALVINGEAQNTMLSEAVRQDCYQWEARQQRICIAQTGPLTYAVVELFGRTDGSAGLTLQQFAEYVAEKLPDALVAYNLDGGGSTNVIVKNERICKTPGLREITDIIYFASAED